jgi:signal peptidase II
VGTIVVLILFLDQLIKVLVKTHFTPYDDAVPLLGNWFVLEYIENPGMAFGTTFGSEAWHKLALSIFRIIAIGGIVYYWFQQAKKGLKLEYLIALGMIIAGATGNLLDSMFYDYFFKFDPCMRYNFMPGSGNFTDCDLYGHIEVRNTGFLLGNVVDMFKFQASWPQWMPFVGGSEVFPAIWNLADFSISCGIGLIILRQKTYFKKQPEISTSETENEVSEDEA